MSAKVKRVKLVQVLCVMLITTVLILSQTTGQNAATIKSQEVKYIYLNAEQLMPLGIELSKEGLFYQNCNPNHKETDVYPYYAFYAENAEPYVNASMSNGCDKKNLDVLSSRFDSVFFYRKITENDFYPVFVGSLGRNYNLSSGKNDTKLLPIAIRMQETKIPNRTDTVLVWFYPTESLKKALPKGIVMEDYLGLPEIK
jgi:hypothetical protein